MTIREPAARRLHTVADDIRAGKYAEALTSLNELATKERRPRFRGRIASMAADVQMAQGRFEDAAAAFDAAAPWQSEHPREWLRPLLGKVRARLKAVQVPEAQAAAEDLWNETLARQEEWDTAVQVAKAGIAAGQAVEIPPVPWRPSVVAARLARLFIQEGEPELARYYHERALALNPLGGCRIRLGLAELALREDDPAEAKLRAREALLLGKFRAKTISAWRLLISAKAKLGETALDPDLLAGLDTAQPSLRARATLEIVKGLRSQHNPDWKTVANRWLASPDAVSQSAIAADLRKMVLAEQRALKQDVTSAHAAAVALLAVPGITALEWLAGAKERVRTAAISGRDTLHDTLLDEASQKFGPGFLPRARHALALAAHEGRRSDVARLLLEVNVSQLPPTSVQWQKSLWALARLERLTHNDSESATRWLQFAGESSVAPRFKVQALRRGLEAVQEAGNLDQAPEVIQRLISVTDQLTDWRELMDVLRQIVQVPGVPPQWLESTITRSIASARLAYSKATNPATALSILMPAMRRMLHDLGRSNEIVTWWQDIGVAAHDWLWSEAEDFWQMLAIVMEAAQQQSARGLALEILNRYTTDTATPLVGRAWLAITHALHLWDIGSPSAAMQVVRVEMKGGDAHPLYAHGYYWEALVSLARGAEHDAHRNAEKCLKCIGQQMHHHWQWELVGKANLILAKFSEQCVLQLGLPFELSSLKALNVEITNDIKKLK